jgi:hypothetical protein
MAYATYLEYIDWIEGEDSAVATAADQTRINLALDTASAAIDEMCFRSFTSASSATSATRTYSVQAGRTAIFVDDFTGTATVTVDGSSVATSAQPVAQGRPYTTLYGSFPSTSVDVDVSAEWGWPATPKAVKLATLMLTAKLLQRRQSPNGIERGNDEMGFIRILGVDKDVQEILRPYARVARSFA